MNREDRANFLQLLAEKHPTLLAGVDTEHVTDDVIMSLVSQAMTPPAVDALHAFAAFEQRLSGHAPASPPVPAVSPQVLTQLLEVHQLRYQDHVAEPVEEGGVTRQVWRTTYRPLTVADLVGSRDAGTQYILVAADGHKYSLPK